MERTCSTADIHTAARGGALCWSSLIFPKGTAIHAEHPHWANVRAGKSDREEFLRTVNPHTPFSHPLCHSWQGQWSGMNRRVRNEVRCW